MDIIIGWVIWGWQALSSEDTRGRITVILAALVLFFTLLGAAWGIVPFVLKLLFKPKPEIRVPTIDANHNVLTPEILDELLEARIAKRLAALEVAHGDEKSQLQAQIDSLKLQRRDPEQALLDAQTHIKSLEEKLTREANTLDTDKLATARAALERGDYSAADDLFAEIEARAAPAVQSAARAAFARGEIAEAEVRWADAATHYARAAKLEPDLQNLFKAREFAHRSGDYPAALGFGETCVRLAGKEKDKLILGKALNDHAALLDATGRYDDAEPLFRQAMAIDKMALGTDHPGYATDLNNLAWLLQATGRYDEAEPLYRQAMAIDKMALGTDHPGYATDLNNLAGLLQATGRYDEAEPLYRQAMAIREAALGTDHPDYAQSLNNLARLLAETKKFEEALPLLEQALKVYEAALGSDHPDTKNARQGVAAMQAAAIK